MITLFLNEAASRLRSTGEYARLIKRAGEGKFPFSVYGPQGSFLALVVKALRENLSTKLYEKKKAPLLIVVPTETEAENLVSDLELFGVQASLFPWWGSIPYRKASPSSPVFGRRVKVLHEMLCGRAEIVVAPLRAFLTPAPDTARFREEAIRLTRGGAIDPVLCAEKLQSFGYLRVPRVSVPGEFALRGEVLDVYMPGEAGPLRVVFEFDTVEALRFFDAENQVSPRSAADAALEEAVLYPVKEVVWTDETLAVLEKNLLALPQLRKDAPAIVDELLEMRGIPGEEMFYPLAASRPHTLFDYLDTNAVTLYVEDERLTTAWDALQREYEGLYGKAREEGPALPPEKLLLSLPRLRSQTKRSVRFTVLKDEKDDTLINLRAETPRSFFGNLDFFREELVRLAAAGDAIYIFADTETQSLRIKHIVPENLPVTIIPLPLSGGFSFPPAKLTVIHEGEIFGRKKRTPKSIKTVESRVIDTFVELSPGDCVVHVNYGIGLFKGIERIKAGGNERDYIHLEYAGSEFIYIPIEQVNLIQRYIGHEGNVPRLDKIGGKSWESRKNHVRKSVEDLAGRLVALYSRRKKERGFAFPPDTEWQLEFEAAFPYEETADQLTAIAEVKADMEKPVPMDRILCGDVGYGKTEVALRAAFKAVTGGKQVALLAPTTILAEQHYENITERVKRYPVTTAMLSRFVSKKDQKTVLEDLIQGRVDLVVGTHRLLQKDVGFRDLGLLIVDEEQRFGVKDKERLKEMKTSVDSLTLTATPIPRTLHMSLLKIRDMSVLKDPPAGRLPIETHITEFSAQTIARAIRREISRGGQVYYLHNRVESLKETRIFLEELVPEALIDTAHGQMSAEELEDIMHRFIHGGVQVLVSTTIVENGIDIPNVNTIIIDRADMYGISQLYQLRGRVGRSDRTAYAYLFYPQDKALSEIAMKRLQIISDNTALGSGFKIALKDLEVRGAGNLLGRQQSGDILSVGFDMYLRILDEAVRSLDSAEPDEAPEVYLELQYTGFIPDAYISGAEEKMEVYKKIASITADEELEALSAELTDRFGPLPPEAASLLALAEIRILCKKLWVSSLRERKNTLEIEFSKVAKISVNRLLALIRDSKGQTRLDPKRPQILLMDTRAVDLKEKSDFIRGRLSALL